MLAKQKVKHYEFGELIGIKCKKNKSKMNLLYYPEFKMQNYFTNLDIKKSQTVLRYRVTMSRFSDNFKGKTNIEPCPLCNSHDDRQSLVFVCPVVSDKIAPQVKYENIFAPVVSSEVAEVPEEIEVLRKDSVL